MANNPKFSNAMANAEAAAAADLLDNGYLRIYDGAQPATADTAISTQTLLAELRFANPSDASVSAGVLTFDTITADSDANATGTAAWFRALSSDGTSVVMDGSVDTASADCVIATTSIVQHAAVSVTSMTLTISKG